MKSRTQWLGIALLTVSFNVASAINPADHAFHALLVPPDMLIQHREEIGLSDKQVEQIRARVEEVGPKARQHQQRVNEATGKLADLLTAETVDADAAISRLDEILAIEKELKHLHLRLMVQVRNELTSPQREVAAKIQRTRKPLAGLEQRLQAKISRIHKEVQLRAEAGQPPFEAVGLMQKFPELMKNGQVKEAEALLDRVSALLGLDKAGSEQGRRDLAVPPLRLAEKMRQLHERVQEMRQSGKDVAEIQDLMRKIRPLMQQGKKEAAEELIDQAMKLTNDAAAAEAKLDEQALLSLEALRAEVDALFQEDVAWRSIEWKTCLLDGLKSSRDQDKPIMLWIFIDRPIDDERC